MVDILSIASCNGFDTIGLINGFNPKEQGNRRVRGREFDRLVRFTFHDLEGYLAYRCDGKTARVFIELEILNLILGYAVLHLS